MSAALQQDSGSWPMTCLEEQLLSVVPRSLAEPLWWAVWECSGTEGIAAVIFLGQSTPQHKGALFGENPHLPPRNTMLPQQGEKSARAEGIWLSTYLPKNGTPAAARGSEFPYSLNSVSSADPFCCLQTHADLNSKLFTYQNLSLPSFFGDLNAHVCGHSGGQVRRSKCSSHILTMLYLNFCWTWHGFQWQNKPYPIS